MIATTHYDSLKTTRRRPKGDGGGLPDLHVRADLTG